MAILFLILGLIILVISGVAAFKNRHNATKCIASITLGILFASIFLTLPTQWIKEGNSVENAPMYSALSSLLYSFKVLGGRQDIAQLESVALLDGVLKLIYICLTYLMFALAPILASSLVLSFIGDTGEKIRYLLSFTPKYCVFSTINQNSIAVAQGIKGSEGKKTIIFCDTKDADKDLVEDAKKLGAILLYKNAKDLSLWHAKKSYEFYFLSENEDENIELTESFILKKEELKKYDIVINSFAQNKTNIAVMESMLSKKACAVFESTDGLLVKKARQVISEAPKTKLVFFNANEGNKEFDLFAKEHNATLYADAWQTAELDESYKDYDINLYYADENSDDGVAKKGLDYCKNHLVTQWQDIPLKIRFVDEIALFCNNLLFEHPLYDLPNNSKDIYVLLVGCGRLGMQMLKTVLWCGQIEGYSLKVRVLDKKAKSIEKEFYLQCPEMTCYDVEFENADAESIDFETAIAAHSNATFVCVATGDDDLNITTAENIYRIFRRNYSGYTPPIFTRIRKIMKSDNFCRKGSFLADRGISLFGTTDSIFSNETLFNSQLENLAFAVHLCYNWAVEKPKESFEYQKALYDFCTSEYSRKSSMAAALHISAKIRSCGIVTRGSLPDEAELAAFEQYIQDDDTLHTLMKNEHERWNAYMRSEGFRTVDFEKVKIYAPQTRSHKDEVARLHPCIVSWDELDELQKKYDKLQQELGLKASDFKEYDKKIVVEIPKIIKRANELCKEGW